MYRLIRNLVAPDKPDSKSFSELVQLMRDHFHPKPSAIVMRFRFKSCFHKQGESVACFVARLRQITEYCDFGTTFQEMLRDRLVCGIADEPLQRQLLAEPSLTFAKALQIAQAHESAEANAKVLRANPSTLSTEEIHTTQQTSPASDSNRRGIVCYRCGGRHSAATCRFRKVDCHHCGKRGHIA